MSIMFAKLSLKIIFGLGNLAFDIQQFSKFYHRHPELIVKYNIGLKTLLQQGISEPIFYGDDSVYKFKRIIGKFNYSDQFKKIQSACLVLNPATIYSYGFRFNCTTVGQASESMTALS